MVILHIAKITNSKFSGVCVVVPQHILAQSKDNDVALLNINQVVIDGIENQFHAGSNFEIEELEHPFNKPDIVVFHECYCIEYISIYRQLKTKRIPYVIIPHGELGLEAQRRKHLKKVIANNTIFKSFIKGALAIQCLSEREKEGTRFGKKRIVATNGIFIPEEVKTVFNSNEVHFVYIGRLDQYHKGLDLLIEAISQKADFLRECGCVFSIYGPHTEGRGEKLKDIIELNKLSDIVLLHDAVSGETKKEVLLNNDVFIQTSRFEGMPLGILEAMSYGIPCLVTQGTTLGEAIETTNAGWMAETTASSIADTIEKAVKSRGKYYEFGRNSRKYVQNNYSWDVIASETVRLYSEMTHQMRIADR